MASFLTSTSAGAESLQAKKRNGFTAANGDADVSSTNGTATPSTETSDDEVQTSTTVTTEVRRAMRDGSHRTRTFRRKGEDEDDVVGADKEERRRADDYTTETQTTSITHVGATGLRHTVEKDGTVSLHPQASSSAQKRGKKIRALITFVPRESQFDRFNAQSSADPFRGFYTLFWLVLFLLMLNTFYTSWDTTGSIISLTFATLFSRDAIALIISDAVLCASTFICVPFALVLKRGWVSYWPTLIWFQHAWQAALLFAVIRWTQYRDWPWVQAGFFTLHTLSMMMKNHSYMAVNGAMGDNYHRMRRVETHLEERIQELAGTKFDKADSTRSKGKGAPKVSEAAWEAAVAEARSAAKANGATQDSADVKKADGWASLAAQRGSSELRQRNTTSTVQKRTSIRRESRNDKEPKSSSEKDAKAPEEHSVHDPHPLVSHPDKLISALASQIEDIREDLRSTGPDENGTYVSWPQNVTYTNFFDYLCCPVLVYELTYPRVKTIRPSYLLEKALAGIGTFCVIYVITEHWIMPHKPSPDVPIIQTFLALAVPMLVNYLLIFFVMFDCSLAFAAEATRFADREYYLDWWNSRSMDEFSRKWNKPVHTFLLRHVYAQSITSGASKKSAMFFTFLLSSLLHELVMAIVSGKIRGYLLSFQMAQIPLMMLSQIPLIKKNPTLGNLIFWIGLACGFPLLAVLYISY